MNKSITYGLPFSEYLKLEGIGSGGMKALSISPAHYAAHLKYPKKQTPAMKLGTLIHSAVLEPKRFLSNYVIEPEFGQKKIEKEAKKKFHDSLRPGAVVVGDDERETIVGMIERLHNSNAASKLMMAGRSEVTVQAEVEGVAGKARIDFLRSDPIPIDYKTTTDASKQGFAKQIYDQGYMTQAVWYMRLLAVATGSVPEDFIFIAQEKTPPYAVGVYNLTELFKEIGEIRVRNAILNHSHYQKALLANEPQMAYEDQIIDIQPENWMLYKEGIMT